MNDITPHEALRTMKRLNVASEAVARRVGLSPQTVRNFVNCHYNAPHRSTRALIAHSLSLFEADRQKSSFSE